MRISDWSSDVCSSDLLVRHPGQLPVFHALGKSGSRIVLRAKNLSQVLRAHEAAHDAGLPCSLFEDAEHILPPDFTGEPVITGIGIGPATRPEMRAITKKFRCACGHDDQHSTLAEARPSPQRKRG